MVVKLPGEKRQCCIVGAGKVIHDRLQDPRSPIFFNFFVYNSIGSKHEGTEANPTANNVTL